MKIHLRMLGCRLNQAEIDMMARHFQQQGHEIVDQVAVADRIIVNTCAVTNDASKSSRKLIRELNRANAKAQIAVTGCYAQLAPDVIKILPGVDHVIDNTGKDTLVEQITGVPIEPFDHEPISRDALMGTTNKTRAFIKVQDGCDNQCTFCVTTIARGHGKSRSIGDIINEIQHLYSLGFQEAVLTGVHLGSYGHDLGDKDGLVHLVHAIFKDTDIPRLRLSSLEPWDLSASFFDLWENPRLLRHLHLPLQSGCDATLKRMLRHTTQSEFSSLVNAARDRIPDLSITTDIIVGFPGETAEEFTISKAFVEAMDFAGLHVFRYSKRPGTPAARMKQHIDSDTKKIRSAQMKELAGLMERRFAERFAGDTRHVLWEQITGATEDGFINVGYTDNYIRVRAIHPRALTNHITLAQMSAYDSKMSQMFVKPIIE